ncbi:Early nodulin-like protein [Musa troglodytarum]|uniref:Early nodulin-like protein n=1 Tax=Musa troglodytarum TaxID=320322 RepID=A0A9E7ERZ2_9LILI|nr:Early nodulin-like protein [Musa troglodytarum]
MQNGCWCYQYKVGDLDCWGLPPPSDPLLYSSWSKNHHFSLVFLYPPSQDSVIQVTERAFNNCGLEDPIMTLRDGNSLFNLSAPGYYYFTSGVAGHCENNQKLAVAIPSANGTFFPPAADFATSPTGDPARRQQRSSGPPRPWDPSSSPPPPPLCFSVSCNPYKFRRQASAPTRRGSVSGMVKPDRNLNITVVDDRTMAVRFL